MKAEKKPPQSQASVKSSRTRLGIILPALSVLSIAATGFIVAQISMRLFLPLEASSPGSELSGAYQKVALWILVLVGLGFLISLGLTLSVVRPLRQLERTFEAISAGQLTPIQDIRGSSELDAVTEAFNQMIASINQMLQHRLTGALFTLNAQGVVTSCNPSAEVLLGISAIDAVGKHFGEVLGRNRPNASLTEAIEKARTRKGPLKLNEFPYLTSDGRDLRLNLDLWFTQDPGQTEPSLIVVFKDFSDLDTLRDNFRPFQQFLALGSLSGYVTHEMKNPVHAIQGTAELLSRHMDPSDPRIRYLKNIQQASEKLVRLIDQLRELASPGLEQASECQPNDILRQAVSFSQTRVHHKQIRMVEEYASDLPRIQGDPHKLFQAFSNIINNAVDAIPEMGSITIRSGLKGDPAAGQPSWLCVEIHNTGSYLDPEQQKRIFQPFHTSKRDGFGLGLWICKKNILSHNGKIMIDSHPDTGTSFRVELPCTRMNP